MEGWTLVAQEGDRELWLNFEDRVTHPDYEGALIHAMILISSTGEMREQTIYEPNYLHRRPETIRRRLRDWPDERLSPQRITGG